MLGRETVKYDFQDITNRLKPNRLKEWWSCLGAVSQINENMPNLAILRFSFKQPLRVEFVLKRGIERDMASNLLIDKKKKGAGVSKGKRWPLTHMICERRKHCKEKCGLGESRPIHFGSRLQRVLESKISRNDLELLVEWAIGSFFERFIQETFSKYLRLESVDVVCYWETETIKPTLVDWQFELKCIARVD